MGGSGGRVGVEVWQCVIGVVRVSNQAVVQWPCLAVEPHLSVLRRLSHKFHLILYRRQKYEGSSKATPSHINRSFMRVGWHLRQSWPDLRPLFALSCAIF